MRFRDFSRPIVLLGIMAGCLAAALVTSRLPSGAPPPEGKITAEDAEGRRGETLFLFPLRSSAPSAVSSPLASSLQQNISLANYQAVAGDWGPALNQAWSDAQTANLPLLIPPGSYSFSTPVTWVGSPQPQIWARGAELQWAGTGSDVAVRYGATLGTRNNGGWIDGLCLVTATAGEKELNTKTRRARRERAFSSRSSRLRVSSAAAGSIGLVIQNTSYGHFVDVSVEGFGTQLQLSAAGTTCGYNLFVRLCLSGGNVGLAAVEGLSNDACLNANQFDYPIIGNTQTIVLFGPPQRWPPSVWTFRGGMFEGPGGALLTATACDVLFDGCYFESSGQPFTLTAPAGNVVWTNCRGTGTGQTWSGHGVWNAMN